MPPKQRFSNEAILDTAFELLCRKGQDAVGAREIAAAMGCSTQPIFSAFGSMENLNRELACKAYQLYEDYLKKGLSSTHAFKGVGQNYLAFAKEQPFLFKLIFMNGDHRSAQSALDVDIHRGEILDSVISLTGLDRGSAEKLYYNVWIFTHGIASLLATGTVDFTEDELDRLLTEAFTGFLLVVMRENKVR